MNNYMLDIFSLTIICSIYSAEQLYARYIQLNNYMLDIFSCGTVVLMVFFLSFFDGNKKDHKSYCYAGGGVESENNIGK